jgi:peptidoglycan/xylan/chitin deacetylase (PgdA/CDA1 family)
MMGTITRVRTQEPVVALTFDDGPHPDYTPLVLDLLSEHQAKATFFVIGEAAEQHPELIERIKADGHALGNHTYSHPVMPQLTGRERRGEVRACGRILGDPPIRLYRPPRGAQTRASRFDLLRLGYQVVAWDAAVEDWLEQPADSLAQRIVDGAKPGGIVLLHDAVRPSGPASASCMNRGYLIDALEIALPKLVIDMRLVTVPAMLLMGRPVYRDWH